MEKESAQEAQRRNATQRLGQAPTGLRRLSLAMLATDKLAEGFQGSPEGQGATRPGQVLAAFKAAAPHIGLGARVVHAIDWLFSFTQPQDWHEGSRPIVWPSAALQRDALGLGVTQAKSLNRRLVELGLVTMKDSPNGKRYGIRDRKGRILEAYGFDLSPLFARMAEFQEAAEEGRALRDRMRQLRRRITIARNGLLQILETAAEQGLTDPAWPTLEAESRDLARALKGVERVEEMELGVAALERRQREARERLESALSHAPMPTFKTVDSDPKGSENRPHQYNYKPNLYPKKDIVMALEESKAGVATVVPNSRTGKASARPERGHDTPAERRDSGTVLRINTDELVRLAPRLKSYLLTGSPAWPDIMDAAEWLRHDLGVSASLWGEACLVMGREKAAIALAIVSAKPPDHFTTSPGSYFHGMVTRAKTGELNLARTVWGLRAGPDPKNSITRRRTQGNHEFMNS